MSRAAADGGAAHLLAGGLLVDGPLYQRVWREVAVLEMQCEVAQKAMADEGDISSVLDLQIDDRYAVSSLRRSNGSHDLLAVGAARLRHA
jgi:hypothetical protein